MSYCDEVCIYALAWAPCPRVPLCRFHLQILHHLHGEEVTRRCGQDTERSVAAGVRTSVRRRDQLCLSVLRLRAWHPHLLPTHRQQGHGRRALSHLRFAALRPLRERCVSNSVQPRKRRFVTRYGIMRNPVQFLECFLSTTGPLSTVSILFPFFLIFLSLLVLIVMANFRLL